MAEGHGRRRKRDTKKRPQRYGRFANACDGQEPAGPVLGATWGLVRQLTHRA
jgi:hypothetical protein